MAMPDETASLAKTCYLMHVDLLGRDKNGMAQLLHEET